MTSTFPTSRSNHKLYTKQKTCEPKDIQSKKESLLALEAALKKRISEFRELCLKEAVSILLQKDFFLLFKIYNNFYTNNIYISIFSTHTNIGTYWSPAQRLSAST